MAQRADRILALLLNMRDHYPAGSRERTTLQDVLDWCTNNAHFVEVVERLVRGMDGSVQRRPLRRSRSRSNVQVDFVEADDAEEASDAS